MPERDSRRGCSRDRHSRRRGSCRGTRSRTGTGSRTCRRGGSCPPAHHRHALGLRQPITGTLSAYGYSVSYSATVGTATVTYPADVIYEEDIAAFAQYIYERHADLLDGVYFEVTTPGTLVITYPEAVTVADGEAVISMLAPELDAFIASYLN